jgi:hypothetical protein
MIAPAWRTTLTPYPSPRAQGEGGTASKLRHEATVVTRIPYHSVQHDTAVMPRF